MSRHELIDGYISGTVNRRAFVQGLTVLGVAAGVAASYAVALQPAEARHQRDCFYNDFYDFVCKKPRRRRKKKKGKKKDDKK